MLKKAPGLSTWIFIGLVLGVIAGVVSHNAIWEGIDYASLSPKMKDGVKVG